MFIEVDVEETAESEGSVVLTYEGWDDPSDEEVAMVLQKLHPLKARAVVPGVIEVFGPRTTVERLAASLDHWRLASVKRLLSKPPNRPVVT